MNHQTESLVFNLGPVNTFVFLSGGSLLLKIIRWAKKSGINCVVITSPRHSEEILEGKSFQELLEVDCFRFLITDKIDTKEVLEFLACSQNKAFFSFGAAWIFKKEVLTKLFGNKLINAHGTRLPENRGGGGFSWQIMMGNYLGYCQLHLVDEGIDTGNIIFTKEFLYPRQCRIPKDFEEFYNKKVFDVISDLMSRLTSEIVNFNVNTQLEYHSTYWPRLNTGLNGWIDWRWSLAEIDRFICAFDLPYSGAKTFYKDSPVAFRNSRIEFSEGRFHPFQTGIVYRVAEGWIYIAKENGTLIIENVIDDNGVDISQSIAVGDRFNTDKKILESAQQRVIYTPQKSKTTP